jgi:hypothetical protein
MKAFRRPVEWITEVGDRFNPKDNRGCRVQELTALTIALVAIVLLLLSWLA